MKKILTLALCIVSTSVLAQIPLVDIDGFTGRYKSELGQASAKVFKYVDQDFGANAQFTMFKQAGVFFLKTPNEEIQLDALPESINELKEISFSGISVKTAETKVDVRLGKLEGKTADKAMAVSDLKLSCSGVESSAELKEYVLDTCFNKLGNVSLANLSADGTSVKNLKFLTNRGKLSFSAKVKGVTAKGSGTTEYRASENKIVIRIDKVKAGFLKVTKKFFKSLSKLESEKVIVKRPFIEILLD